MMTIRRKITNEQERLDAIQPAAVTVRNRRASARMNAVNDVNYENTYTEPMQTNYVENSINFAENRAYTQQSAAPQNTYAQEQMRSYDYPYASTQTAEPEVPQVIRYTTRNEQANAAVAKKKKNASENIVHNLYEQRQTAEPVEKERKQSKTSVKNKVALFAYIAVVLVLAVMVIATGLAVSNINARADKLQSEIEYKTEIVAEQKSQIAVLTDHEHIMGKALGNDMEVIDPESVTVVEMIPATDPIVYQGRTNWFDKFCDFLSNVVGG